MTGLLQSQAGHREDKSMSRRNPVPQRFAITKARASTAIVVTLLGIFGARPGCAAPQPLRAPTKFEQVEALIEQHRLQEARTAVLEAITINPASVEGYNLLGIVEGDLQDYSNSIAAFQKALELKPNSARTHINLGNVYVTQRQPELAEKEFRSALRIEPANRDGNYDLGVLLLDKRSPALAIPYFQRVHPENPETGLNLVRAYLLARRTSEALVETLKLSAENQSNVQLHFSLGILLASQKQYKAAESELEKAAALQPGTFEILYNLGLASLRGGDNANAGLALNRALKLKPESAETIYLLGQVAANQSRPLDALDLLLRAHKLAPDNTDIIYLMAQVSMSQNYFEDSIPLLESGVLIAPMRPDLRAALGESYFMAGKVDKAIEEFNKLLEIEGSARSYAFLGLGYRNLGRFDEARQYFEKGLTLDPHNTSCLFNLGFIAERQGDSAAAESMFQQVLRLNPDFADALLELANLRMASGKLVEAEELLRRYVRIGHDRATGYYKLAKVERSLHESAAADRDLSVFQTLSKNASTGPYPYEHLFDYLDNRSKLAPGARDQLDLNELTGEIERHPDQPEDLYMLAEAFLKARKPDDARAIVEKLDRISAGDYRTLTGLGVLLARYRYYDDAIQHFQQALKSNPDLDEVKFDLADAYFRKHLYPEALDAAQQVSVSGRKDDAYLALLGDIYAHLGDSVHAAEIFRDAIGRNPDDDRNYLALALLQFREKDVAGAKQTLLRGQARIPASGKILWGLGLASALDGNTAQAAGQLERAVDLLPEWPGSYSTLGVFYFQTGQVAKAREVLGRFKNSSSSSSLDVNRIEQVLAQAPESSPDGEESMTAANREQLLQLALSLADRTL